MPATDAPAITAVSEVRSRPTQRNRDEAAELRIIPKWAGPCKAHDLVGKASLFPELDSGASGKLGDRFDEVNQFRHGMAKRSGGRNFFFNDRSVLKADARKTLQLAHGALQNNPPASTNGGRVNLNKVLNRTNAGIRQLLGNARSIAPDFIDWRGHQNDPQFLGG